MPHVIWSQDAQFGLQRAYHFLAARDKQLAKRALRAIHDGAKLLGSRPMLGRPNASHPSSKREFLIRFGRNGYILQYEIDGDKVVIVAIRHQRQAHW